MGNFSVSSSGYSDIAFWNYARDHDSDGITDGSDNCPRVQIQNNSIQMVICTAIHVMTMMMGFNRR